MRERLIFTVLLLKLIVGKGFVDDFFKKKKKSGSEICQQGTRQSPVDVSFNRTVPYCDAGDIGTVMKWGSLVPNLAWHVWDAGDHYEVTFHPGGSLFTVFRNSSTVYYVDRMLLKWSVIDGTLKSEHSVHGTFHELEIQIYHFPTPSSTDVEALAFFVMGKELFNTNWNTFLSTIALSQFHPTGFFMKSPPGHLASLVGVPSYILNSAIKYKGSLTSSPCTENVNWSVYPRIIFIRDTQISLFKRLYFGNHRGTRSVQPSSELSQCYANYDKYA